MRDVFLIGAGQIPVTSGEELGIKDMGSRAIQAAVSDAQVAPDDVGALYVGNMAAGRLSSQVQLGALLAHQSGLGNVEALGVEAACASGGAAARAGFMAVAAGAHDVVVVCGVEELGHTDRASATSALATASDWDLEGSQGETFVTLNASMMRAYRERYGTTAEDFAPFAINAHNNANKNPNALFQKKPCDMERYMGSRTVNEPLKLFDISPISDGAAALVLASGDVAESFRSSGTPGVRIAASTVGTAPVALSMRNEQLHLDAAERANQRAFAQAGMNLDDIDIFELHDAYTIMAALSLEAAGFAEPGRACELAKDGRIGLDGDVPISTFGGLKARGHPVGATGVYQLAEAYLQLSGRAGANQVQNASTALVQNIGGTAATVVNHILEAA